MACLALALVAAVVIRIAVGPSWDGVVTWAGLFAALGTFVVSRWAARRQRRRLALRQVAHEVLKNLRALVDIKERCGVEDRKYQVFPRCSVAALEMAVVSGLFDTARDAELFKCMHVGLQRCTELNRKLDLTETLLAFGFNKDQRTSWYTKMKEGAALLTTISEMVHVAHLLTEHYSMETGIDSETILFDVSDDAGQ